MKTFVSMALFLLIAYFLLSACQLIFGSLTVPGKYVCDKLADGSEKMQSNLILAFKSDGTVEVSTSLSNPNDKNPESLYDIRWDKVILKHKAVLHQPTLSGKFLIKVNELISDDAIKLRCKVISGK